MPYNDPDLQSNSDPAAPVVVKTPKARRPVRAKAPGKATAAGKPQPAKKGKKTAQELKAEHLEAKNNLTTALKAAFDGKKPLGLRDSQRLQKQANQVVNTALAYLAGL